MKPAITKTKKPAIPAAIERAIAREIDEHKAEKAALIAEQAALIAEKAALQAAFDERTAQYEKERAERELQLAAFKKQPEIEQQPEPAAAAVQDTGARARDHVPSPPPLQCRTRLCFNCGIATFNPAVSTATPNRD